MLLDLEMPFNNSIALGFFRNNSFIVSEASVAALHSEGI